ncbi:MAG: phosphatase PAP2 family protein [Lachnospiraceae bacterium]|nr:phosphatase PAP2 family protein [Lachnospiraceae bacterium]
MKRQSKFIMAGVSGLMFVIWILLVRTVDVDSIGPEGTRVGLSHINKSVSDSLGQRLFWYDATEVLGIIAILVAAAFAFTGLVQLIKRKSLSKVDKEIFALGGLYIIVIGLYALFEVVVINFRPVIMQGEEHPEASFPSSHTMLICVVMGSTIMLLDKYIKNNSLCNALKILCAIIMVVTVVGRLVSGVHWFTDIIGGVIISVALLALFSGILDVVRD